jgi:site-specific DNA-cytosine methylase
VREYARIQGFPDDWQLAGPKAAKYRQIGNAVPAGLGEPIGKALMRCIYSKKDLPVFMEPKEVYATAIP